MKLNESPGKRSSGCINASQPWRPAASIEQQIVTALARELLGFMWAIAVHTEAQFKLTKAA